MERVIVGRCWVCPWGWLYRSGDTHGLRWKVQVSCLLAEAAGWHQGWHEPHIAVLNFSFHFYSFKSVDVAKFSGCPIGLELVLSRR